MDASIRIVKKFMQRNNNSIIWNPGELIYEIGSMPEEAYLILEGYVIIETKDQFQLNRLGKAKFLEKVLCF